MCLSSVIPKNRKAGLAFGLGISVGILMILLPPCREELLVFPTWTFNGSNNSRFAGYYPIWATGHCDIDKEMLFCQLLFLIIITAIVTGFLNAGASSPRDVENATEGT